MVAIIVLLFLSFLQGAFIPLNLVLVFLIIRSFIVDDRENLWLAFGFGLLLSLLLNYPLGSLSILYVIVTELVKLIKKTHLASFWLAILPLSFLALLFNRLIIWVLGGGSFNFWWVVLEVSLVLPAYFVVRLWEERFVTRKDIRLKVGK